MKKTKTGGRTKGTRNKINLFGAETIDKAKVNIAELVAQGDIEASKLVISYSMSKPALGATEVQIELDELKIKYEIERLNRSEYYRIEALNNPDPLDFLR